MFSFCLVIFLVSTQLTAAACSCAENSICRVYARSETIFVGTALASEPSSLPGTTARARFKVIEKFKGTVADEAFVFSDEDVLSCGVPQFAVGHDYLVVARSDKDGNLIVGPCNSSRPVEFATGELNFLRARSASSGNTQSMLYGLLVRFESEQSLSLTELAGIKIHASGENGRFQTQTDSKGYFEIRDLPPGRYMVKADLPDTLVPVKNGVEIGADGCAGVTLSTTWNGRIHGCVVGPKGTGLPDVAVTLFNLALPPGEQYSARTGSDGCFTSHPLDAGRYRAIIGDSPVFPPSEDFPFPPMFYPGVFNPEAAAVIEVAKGQKIENIDFRVPEFSPHMLRVVAVGPDSRPIKDAQFSIEYEHTYCWTKGCAGLSDLYQGDEAGRAIVPAYGDGKVRVYALSPREAKGERRMSAGIEIDLQNASKVIRFVVDRPYDSETKQSEQ